MSILLVIWYCDEGLGLLKLADTSLILINPSPSNVNHKIHLKGIEFNMLINFALCPFIFYTLEIFLVLQMVCISDNNDRA